MAEIPPNVLPIFEKLKSEIIWIHGRWIIYRQIFAKSQRRIDLLNECASTFFYVIQNVLIGEVQISLSKLMDPAQTRGSENLSLKTLYEKIALEGDVELTRRLNGVLERLRIQCEPFRTWRNKRLAHLDLKASLESELNPLPGVSREMIEEGLVLVRLFMNEIERAYLDSETGYEHFILDHGDGDGLIAMLRYGLRYKELLKEEKIAYGDWRNGNWHDA